MDLGGNLETIRSRLTSLHFRPIVESHSLKIRGLLQALDAARYSADFELFAFVVMPEHCHVLLCPKNEEYAMGEILTKIKSPAAKAILAARPELRSLVEINRSRIRIPTRDSDVSSKSGESYRLISA